MANTFMIDVDLLNRHLAGANKDDTRKVLHNTVLFHAHDGVIDVVSTDGRIMLHSELKADKAYLEGGDFEEVVLRVPSGKVAGRKGERAIITLDGKNAKISTSKGAIAPEVEDGLFPRWRMIFPQTTEPLALVRWHNPKYLMLVFDYLKQNIEAYTNPQVPQGGAGATIWTLEGEDMIRRAALMPIGK